MSAHTTEETLIHKPRTSDPKFCFIMLIGVEEKPTTGRHLQTRIMHNTIPYNSLDTHRNIETQRMVSNLRFVYTF
jgi:hypothetical protein